MYLTRNQAWVYAHRGFESHPLRQPSCKADNFPLLVITLMLSGGLRLLLWFYYTARIFPFGAEFTACMGGLERQTPPAAVSRPAIAKRRLGRE